MPIKDVPIKPVKSVTHRFLEHAAQAVAVGVALGFLLDLIPPRAGRRS